MSIPAEYLKLLGPKSTEGTVVLAGRGWRLFSPEQLGESVVVDGKEIVGWQMLSAYAHTFGELTGQSDTVDQDSNDYPLDRLREGVAIGDNDGGAILYLDGADGLSLWAYYPDGGDVTKLGVAYGELLSVLGSER